jgi:hypothetical protein
MYGEQIRQAVQDIAGIQRAGDDNRQTLAGELLDHSQHTEFMAVLSVIFDEIHKTRHVRDAPAEDECTCQGLALPGFPTRRSRRSVSIGITRLNTVAG